MKRILSVFLAVMMVLSTVSFAVPQAVTVLDAVEEFVKAAYGNDSSVSAEETWIDNDKGIKLFVIDLDGDTNYTQADLSKLNNRIDGTSDNSSDNGLYLSEVGRVNPDYSTYANTFKYSFKDGGTPAVSGTDDKYFTHEATVNPSVMIANPIVGAGTYTVVFNHTAGKQFSLHSGYTGGSFTTTAIDSTWATTSYTVDISAAGANDYFRIRSTTDADTYIIDDIELYYKPEGWTPPTEGGDEGDEGEESGDWTHPTYGTKLFNMDFDTDNNGKAVTADALTGINAGRINSGSEGILISTVGQINPTLSAVDTSDYRVSLYDGTGNMTYSLENVEGSQGLGFIASGSYKPSLYIGGVYDKAGPYTIVIEYKYDDGGSGIKHDKIQFANPTATYYDGTLSSGDLTTVPYTREYADSDTYISQRLVFYCNSSTTFTGSEKFIIDNLSVYYYDENIDYTEPEEPSTDEWESEEYGTKLYEINFDTKTDGSAVTENDLAGIDNGRLDENLSAGILVSNIGKINPGVNAGYSSDYRISVKDLTYSLGSDGDRTFLDIKSTTEKPCFMLGGFNDREGKYTVVIDYRYLKNTSSFVHDRLFIHSHGINILDKSILSNGNWVSLPYTFSTLDGYTGNYLRIVFYSNGNYFTGVEEFQIDKISVYYNAGNAVKVTVSANGNPKMNDVVMPDISADGVRVADILARITNNSGKQLLGISKTADGETLSVGETLVLSDNSTLYMIWGNEIKDKEITWTDAQKGYLLYDIDFETEKQFLRNYDKLSLYGNVNTSIAGSDEWTFSGHYYVDDMPGSGSSSYEPLEFDIKSELVDGVYNKYLVVKPDGTSRWPQLMLRSYASATSIFGDRNGVYTIEGDVRVIKADGSKYSYTSQVTDMGTYNPDTGAYTTTQTSQYGSTSTVGEWAKMLGVCDDKAYDGLSTIKICNQYSETSGSCKDIIHFDNLKLYWKPHNVTVTFDNSSVMAMPNQTVSVSTEGTMTVGELKSYVKPNGLKKLKGLSKVKDGVILSDETVIDLFGNLTFYTVWEDKDMTGWTDEDYGVLLYDLDFDSAEEYTSGGAASAYGRVNPNYAGSENWTVLDHYFNNVTLADDGNGNKYLAATVGDTARYPQIQVSAENSDSYVFTSGGIYTLIADVKVASSDNYTTNSGFVNITTPLNAATNNNGIWSKVQTPAIWSSSDRTLLSDWTTAFGTFNASDYDGVANAIFCLSYSSLPAKDKETLYLDNLKLFWKPDKVLLTVNPGDNKLARTHSFAVGTGNVTVSEIMSKIVDHGDMILKGISYTKNGEPITGTINIGKDTTLYALWEETGEVLSKFSVEFEYDESSGVDVYWSNHGTNSDGNSYVRNTDGYGVFTFNANKDHSAVWDSNLSFSSFVSNSASAGEIKAIMIRMRYRNVPHFDCTCATDVNSHFHEYKTGATNTYDNRSQYVQLFYLTPDKEALNESQSLKYYYSVADGDGIEDGWFTMYIDVSENADFRDKGITNFRFDFNNDMWDGTVIDIDYIRFIGDKIKAPVTQNNNSLKTTDPMGIRFMASLKKNLLESTTSYGWVIAREVSLSSAGITNADFTYEAATDKSVAVLKGYNFKEGGEEALNFDEDSVNVYFAAMLYNIPENMYEDKLVARPFAEVDGVIYYGTPLSKSVYDVAKSLRDSGFAGCTAAQQTYIQRVIDKVEKA